MYRMKAIKTSLLVAALLGLVCYYSIEHQDDGHRQEQQQQQQDRRGLQTLDFQKRTSATTAHGRRQLNQDNRRPVMHTFFELKTNQNGDLDTNGSKYHNALLETWKQLWYDAGWEPVILTLEDAKQHPEYEKYSEALSGAPGIENVYQGGYDHLCFMRWLAMATVPEGGWMSDYDTFPLGIQAQEVGFTLPNAGQFTSYERHVPSLLSGSGDEWERMTIKVMGTAIRRMERGGIHGRYSDMFALAELNGYYLYGVREGYRNGQKPRVVGYPYSSKRVIDCASLRTGVYAMHLAHHYTRQAIENDLLDVPEGRDEKDRDHFAQVITKRWHMQCDDSPTLEQGRGDYENKEQSLRGTSSATS